MVICIWYMTWHPFSAIKTLMLTLFLDIKNINVYSVKKILCLLDVTRVVLQTQQIVTTFSQQLECQ